MRIWHYALLPYLPELQFKGQLRELVAIMHDWRDKGKTNHLLINRVMQFDKVDLYQYWRKYAFYYWLRYNKDLMDKYEIEFVRFCKCDTAYEYYPFYPKWHNEEYLRVCMANLYEKHVFGVGKSRITDEEWQRLLDGYKQIIGEDYVI